MIDQQTIDRVCVGLADLAIDAHQAARLFGDSVAYHHKSTAYRVLLDLIGCDLYEDHIPEWAERALDDHSGTPEELVAALRELAGMNTKEPELHTCAVCDREIVNLVGDGGWPDGWQHYGLSQDHPATPKGEPE